jgi:hypothetical protein
MAALPLRAAASAAQEAGALLHTDGAGDCGQESGAAHVGPPDVKSAAIAACLASYVSRQRGHR